MSIAGQLVVKLWVANQEKCPKVLFNLEYSHHHVEKPSYRRQVKEVEQLQIQEY